MESRTMALTLGGCADSLHFFLCVYVDRLRSVFGAQREDQIVESKGATWRALIRARKDPYTTVHARIDESLSAGV